MPSAIILFELGFILLHAVIALPSNSILDRYPLLLNSSIITATRGVNCFRQPPPFHLPKHDDCVTAIDQILQNPDVMTSKTWTVTGIQTTAAAWSSGTCLVEIGVWTESPSTHDVHEDTFSMFSFVGKAQAVVEKCVAGRKKAGGTSVIGPKKVFQVLVRYTAQASFE